MGLVTTMRLIAFGELMPNRGAASAYCAVSPEVFSP